MAKKFMYVCAGLLMLAIAFHLGATTAQTQGTGAMTLVSMSSRDEVVMANGDVYGASEFMSFGQGYYPTRWVKVSNVFTSMGTPVKTKGWSETREKYK